MDRLTQKLGNWGQKIKPKTWLKISAANFVFALTFIGLFALFPTALFQPEQTGYILTFLIWLLIIIVLVLSFFIIILNDCVKTLDKQDPEL